MIPYHSSAHKLLMEGVIALSKVETNGIRMDVSYLKNTIQDTSNKISDLEKKLKGSNVSKEWKKMFGGKMNFNSNNQLGKVLFDGLGYKCPERTDSGKYKVDEKTLSTIDLPFVKDYLEIKKLQHINDTYLTGILRETVDGFLHPFFNLHTATTFRSSSSNPNFQNLPIRDPILGRLVRRAFIARPGHRIVELDYSGLEVHIAACYHKDPVMIDYLNDPTKDMHRDASMDCYLLSEKEMTNPVDEKDEKRIKKIRYCGKNKFVFPEFYGDWYIDCAKALWESIDEMGLDTRSGLSLKEHLRNKGITKLGELDPRQKPQKGTFEKHIQGVENSFWNDRFKVYTEWKKDWVSMYQRKGYMLTKTGFICQGEMRKNEIINYPIQGSAFHCLLKSLIDLVNVEMRKLKMKSLIVGQIHDSIVGDIVDGEFKEYLALAKYVMTEKLVSRWKWINVPLEVEAEASPVDGCWADKRKVKI